MGKSKKTFERDAVANKKKRDVRAKYTESKRTAGKNSVTPRNSRKSERDEGGEVNPSREKAASRVTEFMNDPLVV